MTITKHARKRLRQRVGLPFKAHQRHVDKVWRDGKPPLEVWDLGPCAANIRNQNGAVPRVYGRFVYLFGKNELITVMSMESSK